MEFGTLSFDAALQFCQKSAPTASGPSVFQFWVQKLGTASGRFADGYWLQLTKFLREEFDKIIYVNSTEGELAALELSSWLDHSREFLEWLDTRKLKFPDVCLILEFHMYTISGFLSFYQERSEGNDLQIHLQKGFSLLNTTLKLLGRLDNHHVENDKEFLHLTKMITALSDIGERPVSLDMKMILETWKCVVKLITLCSKWSPLQTTVMVSKRVYVKRPMQILLQKIEKNIITIYKDEILKSPIEQVEKYLRITNFYVKLLHRMAIDSKHEFPAAEEFLHTVDIFKRMPKFLINTKIAELMDKYVCNDFSKLFNMVYKSSDIRELISRRMQEHKPEADFHVLAEYLHASVVDRDSEYIDSNKDMYTTTFEHLFKDPACFIDPIRFNLIVELFAALLILSSTSALKIYFRSNVLTADFPLAHASTEVLLIVSRSSHTQNTPDELLNEFRFWSQCNDSFATFSCNPRQMHIQRLLKNFFQLCRSCSILSNSDSLSQYTGTALAPSNYKFFLTVGLATTSSSESSLQSLRIKLSEELFELIRNFERDFTSEHFYKMIVFIVLLTTAKSMPKKELLVPIFELFARVVKNVNFKPHQMALFLEANFYLAAVFPNAVEESTLRNILEVMRDVLQKQGKSVPIQIINFLTSFSSRANSCQKMTIENFVRNLRATSGSGTFRCLLGESSQLTNTAAADDFKVFKGVYSTKSWNLHVCAAEKKFEGQPNKRLRVDDTHNSNLKVVVKELLEKSQTVVKLCNTLDNNDISTLNNIVNNLKSALQTNKRY